MTVNTSLPEHLPAAIDYAGLLDTLAEGVVVIDSGGRIVDANPAAESILGRMGSTLVHRSTQDPHWNAIHEDGTPFAIEDHPALAALRLCRPQRGTLMGVTALDGRRRWLQVNADPLLDGQGRAIGAMASFADISTVKRAEHMLRAIASLQSGFISARDMRKRFAGLLDDCLQLTDSAFGFIGEVLHRDDGAPYLRTYALTNIAWSAETRALYDAKVADGFIFERLDTLFGAVLTGRQTVIANDPANDPRAGGLPPGHPPLHAFIGLPIVDHGEIIAMLGLANRPGGYDSALADFLSPLLGAAGKVLAADRARSAEKSLRASLLEQSRNLARSNADLEQFAYVVSHDLRQPLRMMHSNLQMIEEDLHDTLGDEHRESMRYIREGAQRMDQMLVGLLEYSRVGRQSGPHVAVSSRAAVDEALRYLRPLLDASGAQVDIAGEWPIVLAGEAELVRLFQNLLDNAIKYQPRGQAPHIVVSAASEATQWCFSVRDNGIGIDSAEQAARLFRIFQRLHGRGHYQGDGIGLAVCRRIVEHFGGHIALHSAGKGQGCEVRFTLPHPGAGSTPHSGEQ